MLISRRLMQKAVLRPDGPHGGTDQARPGARGVAVRAGSTVGYRCIYRPRNGGKKSELAGEDLTSVAVPFLLFTEESAIKLHRNDVP